MKSLFQALRLSIALALTVSMAGCLRVAPKIPAALTSSIVTSYSAGNFESDVSEYRSSIKSQNLDLAKSQRNQIIFRVLAQIDVAYGRYESQLATTRAGAQTAGDAAQLGLTAAATVVGASGVKDILSATSTALQGTRLSFDKNFFEQKTTESLVSQMRASRKNLKTTILLNTSTRDVNSYPVEAAWMDLVSYYYAGTITSALVDISSKAGADAQAADQNLKRVVKELTPATPLQAKQAVSVRTEYEILKRDIKSADPAIKEKAIASLKRILTQCDIGFDPAASAADLLATLKTAIGLAADDDAALSKLNAAVQVVNGSQN